MSELIFRKLFSHEVDVRVGTNKAGGKGASLLLYKDARCDMNILDDTVGSLGWQRTHTRDNANCIVSIYDDKKNMWISKEDTGTESMTEKEKGMASDSFKRACVNWGIGRELYTAPFIWIDRNVVSESDIKFAKFKCDEIGYDDNGVIDRLVISSKGKTIYSFGSSKKVENSKPKIKKEDNANFITKEQIEAMNDLMNEERFNDMLVKLNLKKIEEMTEESATVIISKLVKETKKEVTNINDV